MNKTQPSTTPRDCNDDADSKSMELLLYEVQQLRQELEAKLHADSDSCDVASEREILDKLITMGAQIRVNFAKQYELSSRRLQKSTKAQQFHSGSPRSYSQQELRPLSYTPLSQPRSSSKKHLHSASTRYDSTPARSTRNSLSMPVSKLSSPFSSPVMSHRNPIISSPFTLSSTAKYRMAVSPLTSPDPCLRTLGCVQRQTTCEDTSSTKRNLTFSSPERALTETNPNRVEQFCGPPSGNALNKQLSRSYLFRPPERQAIPPRVELVQAMPPRLEHPQAMPTRMLNQAMPGPMPARASLPQARVSQHCGRRAISFLPPSYMPDYTVRNIGTH